MIIKLLIMVSIGGFVGYIGAYYLYPIIGYWFVIPCIVAGLLIGFFGSELLHREVYYEHHDC